MNRRFLLHTLGLLLPSSLAICQGNALNWWVMDMGYAASGAGNTRLFSAVGQSLVGVMIAGNTVISGGFLADTLVRRALVSVTQESGEIPLAYELGQNYPNPFNPTTTVEFSLPKGGSVSLVVYDMLGRTVETLVDGELAAGRYRAVWNAQGYSSGMYLCRLQVGDFVAVRKLVLLK